MEGHITERDWKYMRSIQKELLLTLCARINEQAKAIICAKDGDPLERFRQLYSHVQASDHTVAVCFDDWRRSSIDARILALHHHGLLTDKYLVGLFVNDSTNFQ
jgi:hypothetical protein